MSWSERSVRYHKQQTDCAIHRAYVRLATDTSKFHELLQVARKRARRLWEAPVLNGYHPGVEALLHLARFEVMHIRKADHWPGTASSWQVAAWSLAHHLLCKYEVPVFLGSVWYATEGPAADEKRGGS